MHKEGVLPILQLFSSHTFLLINLEKHKNVTIHSHLITNPGAQGYAIYSFIHFVNNDL